MLFDWFTGHRRITIAICTAIVILTILISTFRSHFISEWIINYLLDWSIALSAGAAIVLLYVVYISILQTRRMRQEDRELDFKRRQLDGILSWAQEIRKELFIPRMILLAEYNLKQGLANCNIGSEWAIMTADIFGDEFQSKVKQLAEDLKAYIIKLSKENQGTLIHSLNEVLEAAFKLKLEHKF